MSYSIGFILLPGFSEWSYWSSSEPIHRINEILGRQAYSYFSVGAVSQSIKSDLGHTIVADYSFQQAPSATAWIVIGSNNDVNSDYTKLSHELAFRYANSTVMGVSSGVRILADSGLLNGFRAVMWPGLSKLNERYSNIDFVAKSFCLDKKRLTCIGRGATMSMILTWISHQQGIALTSLLRKEFEAEFKEMLPGQLTSHPCDQQSSYIYNQPGLSEALELMHSNLREPLTTQEIADHLKLSRRQLERLFKKHLGTVPSQYYMKIRLENVRQMLQNTPNSITFIADVCGFSSGAHLSSCYKKHFGVNPSADRRNTTIHFFDKA